MAMTVGVSRDITERKRAQETLRRRANQLETVAVVFDGGRAGGGGLGHGRAPSE